MNIQWYPGHMTKAKRQMQEDIKLIDLVVELVDARCVNASRNPDIDKLAAGKARLILLNKADLADKNVTAAWVEYFAAQGIEAYALDSRVSKNMKSVNDVIEKACAAKRERDLKRGIKNRPIRAMVVGIPNVGKSTFINSYAGKACAKTGNKPGVTKGKQWIKLNKSVELLDTPGILWPKFEDDTVGLHLAWIGSINDQILQKEELCISLMKFLLENYKEQFLTNYGVPDNEDVFKILEEIAKTRNCIKKGDELDFDKAESIIIDDFRSGKLGYISIEKPEV